MPNYVSDIFVTTNGSVQLSNVHPNAQDNVFFPVCPIPKISFLVGVVDRLGKERIFLK